MPTSPNLPASNHNKPALQLRAAQLKQHFAVYGSFYQLTVAGQEYPCRSVLELIAHSLLPENIKHISNLDPDLLVVMMNPGSSKPRQEGYTPQHLHKNGQPEEGNNLVLTRPDNTQYQIMRLMAHHGMQHARVLNLSDLREPKSTRLMPMIESLASLPGGERHSLFCTDRQAERQSLMGPHGAVPVLAGWGRHKTLLPLAKQCLKQLQGWQIIGVATDAQKYLYAHPSPMLQRYKDQWLNEVSQQLT